MARWLRRTAYTVAITLLGAAAASGGVLAWRSLNPPPMAIAVSHAPTSKDDAPQLAPGDPRPQFALPDLEGVRRDVSEWDGRLLLVNFWATWCPPCLEEIPAFVRLQADYEDRGVQFLGIAIDSGDNVRQFAGEHAMNYPTLVGQAEGIELSKRFGNGVGALPYTVVVARDGRVLVMHHGVLDEGQARDLIERHL